jgi:outer membrane immunogenic protein
MKRAFLALVSLAALTGMAAAADLPRPAPAPYYKAPVMAPAYNWSGFYIGINGGGGFGRSTWDSTGSFNISGGMVGGTVGYNYQIGQAVVGLEGDIDWAVGRHQRHHQHRLPARL